MEVPALRNSRRKVLTATLNSSDGRQRFAVEVHECRTSEAATNVEYDIVWAWDRVLGVSPWPRLQWGGLPVAIPENRLRGVGPGSRSAEVA